MTLETSKTLGGIGAILMFIGIFPIINYYLIVELIGAVLILAALHGLGSYYKQMGIFNNAIYGVAAGIVGVVIAAVAAAYTFLTSITDLLRQVYPGWNGEWSTLQGMTPDTTNLDPSVIFPIIAGLLVVVVIVWIFAIVATFFIWRSLRQASSKTGTGLFGTAGILLFIGAIIPIIGLILMWISALLLAIAFFTLKSHQEPMAVPASPPPPAMS